MYKIIKASYPNFKKTVDGYRLSVAEPFELMMDSELYKLHKQEESEQYKALSDFLFHIRDCRKCGTILWELEGVGIEGKPYNIANKADLDEQHKTLHMFLNLSYW